MSKGSEIPGTGYHVTSMKNYAIAPDISERVKMCIRDSYRALHHAAAARVVISGHGVGCHAGKALHRCV